MPERETGRPRRRTLSVVGAAATALIIAVATATGTGLGSKLLRLFDEDAPLVTASAQEGIAECGTQLFVNQDRVNGLVSRVIPQSTWTSFQRLNAAQVAGGSAVEVSIQGESSRTITLTRVEFDVERKPRPPGAVFSNPCGGPFSGRLMEVSLDRQPVAVVHSNSDPAGGTDRPPRPIRFPWTVSVTDPLLLTLVATTHRCYCTWRAFVNWSSGSKTGRLAIDNGGRGYTVVGMDGLRHYVHGSNRWEPLG